MDDKVPSRILNYLYLGGKHHAKARGLLKSLNINYILNCTPNRSLDPESGCPNFFEKDKSITYKRISIFDNRGEDILAHMEAAITFIEQGKHYGAVLVHCHKGISRSATFVIGYLMNKNSFTFQESLDFVQSCRPIVQPNMSFISQLQKYGDILNASRIENEKETQKYPMEIKTSSELEPLLGPSVSSSNNYDTIEKENTSVLKENDDKEISCNISNNNNNNNNSTENHTNVNTYPTEEVMKNETEETSNTTHISNLTNQEEINIELKDEVEEEEVVKDESIDINEPTNKRLKLVP